jgi:hypothetical protein
MIAASRHDAKSRICGLVKVMEDTGEFVIIQCNGTPMKHLAETFALPALRL